MPQYGYVYILASKGRRLYIGVTSNLERRVWQHKNKADPNCFTARYNIDQLVYFERHPLVTAAIAREKQLKGWSRVRKIALIVANNGTWKDLSAEWGEAVPAFQAPAPKVNSPAGTNYGDPSFAQDDGGMDAELGPDAAVESPSG